MVEQQQPSRLQWNEFQQENKGRWSQKNLSAQWQLYKAGKPLLDLPDITKTKAVLKAAHAQPPPRSTHQLALRGKRDVSEADDLHLPDGSPKARNGHTAPTRISHVAPAPAQPPLTHTRPAAPAPAQPPPAHTTYVAPVQSPPSLAPSSPQGSRASSFTATGSGSAYVFPPRVNQSDQGLSTHLCLENSTISNTANTNTSIRVSRTLGQSGWNSFQKLFSGRGWSQAQMSQAYHIFKTTGTLPPDLEGNAATALASPTPSGPQRICKPFQKGLALSAQPSHSGAQSSMGMRRIGNGAAPVQSRAMGQLPLQATLFEHPKSQAVRSGSGSAAPVQGSLSPMHDSSSPVHGSAASQPPTPEAAWQEQAAMDSAIHAAASAAANSAIASAKLAELLACQMAHMHATSISWPANGAYATPVPEAPTQAVLGGQGGAGGVRAKAKGKAKKFIGHLQRALGMASPRSCAVPQQWQGELGAGMDSPRSIRTPQQWQWQLGAAAASVTATALLYAGSPGPATPPHPPHSLSLTAQQQFSSGSWVPPFSIPPSPAAPPLLASEDPDLSRTKNTHREGGHHQTSAGRGARGGTARDAPGHTSPFGVQQRVTGAAEELLGGLRRSLRASVGSLKRQLAQLRGVAAAKGHEAAPQPLPQSLHTHNPQPVPQPQPPVQPQPQTHPLIQPLPLTQHLPAVVSRPHPKLSHAPSLGLRQSVTELLDKVLSLKQQGGSGDMDPRVAVMPEFGSGVHKLRSQPRERVPHNHDRLFWGFSDWVAVSKQTLRDVRYLLPRHPGVYEWGTCAPDANLSDPASIITFYLGKAGRLKDGNETLRSRFIKYSGASNACWVAPSKELDKAALWRELQRRGFKLFYRWRICEDVEPEKLERWLLEQLDYAANSQRNQSRRQLLLNCGRTLAQFPVLHLATE